MAIDWHDEAQPTPARGDWSFACGKRRYRSPAQARRVTQNARFRIKVYRCRSCHGYHVANGDKRSY